MCKPSQGVERAATPRVSIGLTQLFKNRGIFQRAGVLRDDLTFGDAAQQTAHDLAAACLGQVLAKADVLGLGDGADLLKSPLAQFGGHFFDFVPAGPCALQDHEGADRLAGGVVGAQAGQIWH